METRYPAHPEDVKHYTTERLRKDFLMEELMVPDQIKFVYSHFDRVIAGGAVPVAGPLSLDTYPELRAEYFLERRELGIINIAGKGFVTVNGVKWELDKKECLYVGKGVVSVVFESLDASLPAKFYLVSTPAHKSYPTVKKSFSEAMPMELGSKETANERTVYKYIHLQGIESCQLVMGLTTLKTGSVWNTIPSHFHDRRMEMYFYFDLPADQRVLHLMGYYNETRHLVVANEQGVISPMWSIHSGAGTTNYSFIWAMGGENLDYADMDPVTFEMLK